MKTKDLSGKLIAKTLHTTLACMVASTAFALDDRLEEPKPDNQPDPETPGKPATPRPDLVPMGIEASFDHLDDHHRIYSATVTVANYGKADSDEFMCLIGYKVLATTDAGKYPVGSTHYSGFVPFDGGLKVMDMADSSRKWAFHIPKAVSGAQIFMVVDRFWNWFDPADIGTWEDDAGKDLVGNIVESSETNNVLGGKTIYYYEYNPPDTEVSLPKDGITVKPKGRE